MVTFTVAMMILASISVSLYGIPSNALTPELIPNYDEPTPLQSYRWFFGIIGGALVTLMLNEVFVRVGPHNTLGILDRRGYAQFGALATAVMFISITLSAAGAHGRVATLPQALVRRWTLG